MKHIIYTLCGICLFGNISFARFKDIDVTHPHYYAIEFLKEKDVIQGYKQENEVVFKSFQPVIRAEALKMLMRTAGHTPPKNTTNSFPDIATDSWYSPYVEQAHKKGFVNGFPNGLFHPEYTVTNAEFLKMALLAFNAPVSQETQTEEWYDPYIKTAKKWNIFDGEIIDPAKKLTRGEIAEILYRLFLVRQNNFQDPYIFQGFGESSYYGFEFDGKTTANGEIYNPNKLTAAHRTLPFGTYIKVTRNDKFVVVRINDRGPYHEKRILDLSQKAFEHLAPLSKGVIDIQFKVVSGPEEEKPEIPDIIQKKIGENEEDFSTQALPETVESVMQETPETGRAILFPGEVITHISEEFFPNAELRHPIPQIIPQGTFKNIKGRSNEYKHESVNIFLQKIGESNQRHFEGTLSGKNFTIPVSFLETGRYHMGLVFDNQKKSRVAEIEVRSWNKPRWFPASEENFSSEMEYQVIPEEQQLLLSWETQPNIITKIEFTQGQYTKTLYIEDGLKEIKLPYNYFQVFNKNQELSISLFAAFAKKETLSTQQTNWKKIDTENFLLIPGFPDTETDDISISHFSRYQDKNETITLNGQIQNNDTVLYEFAYLQTPNGFVKEIPIDKKSSNTFSIQIKPEGKGAHIIQIISTEKETLFKRAIYATESYVLPVKEWPQTPVRGGSKIAIRDWINNVRSQYNLSIVNESQPLSQIAQEYADYLAENNILSHTTLEGKTFEERIIEDKENRLENESHFGENLSQAETLEKALWGLENSMSHRKNLLTQKWNKVGIGMTKKENKTYIVQIFAQDKRNQ